MMIVNLGLLFVLTGTGYGASIPGVALNNTLTIGYIIPWSHDWPIGPSTGSAISLGIKEVERRGLLPGYQIDWVIEDTYCQVNHGKWTYVSAIFVQDLARYPFYKQLNLPIRLGKSYQNTWIL